MKVHLADRTEGVVLDRVGMEPECLLAEMGKANIDGAHKQTNKQKSWEAADCGHQKSPLCGTVLRKHTICTFSIKKRRHERVKTTNERHSLEPSNQLLSVPLLKQASFSSILKVVRKALGINFSFFGTWGARWVLSITVSD